MRVCALGTPEDFVLSRYARHYVRQEIVRLLKYAPPEMRKAILALFPAAKRVLDSGYHPAVRDVPLKGWRCLLTLLGSVAAMQTDAEMLLRVANDLLAIADRMAPPDEVLRQSAEILIHALYADLYVCRLRTPKGEWKVRAAARADGGASPIVAPILEESMRQHPVMRTILEGRSRYVVSNNLHALDKGGESFDCVIYKEGYRSRLAFVLRERSDRPPFGLVMLYTKREYGFESFDARFLAKCAGIVSLTVGRRVAVARDTLEKAAGAMAHYGNNVLNVLRNEAAYCGELAEDIDKGRRHSLRLTRQLLAEVAHDSRSQARCLDVERSLTGNDLAELSAHLGNVLKGTRRMTRIINSLKKSAERPRLMHYALGQDVLRLEDMEKEE